MIIYSRFNCRQHVIDNDSSVSNQLAARRMEARRFQESWLKDRLDLFNTYTLPSILSQTDKNFHWVGIVHPDSPKWFIDELEKISILDLKLSEWDVDAKVSGDDFTVNLDTDDALSRNFVEEAKKVDFQGETIFPLGMRYRENHGGYLIYTRTNYCHFNIVQHPSMTVLDGAHGQTGLKKNIVESIRKPMWLEILHGDNIMNLVMKKTRKDKNLAQQVASRYFDVKRYRVS